MKEKSGIKISNGLAHYFPNPFAGAPPAMGIKLGVLDRDDADLNIVAKCLLVKQARPSSVGSLGEHIQALDGDMVDGEPVFDSKRGIIGSVSMRYEAGDALDEIGRDAYSFELGGTPIGVRDAVVRGPFVHDAPAAGNDFNVATPGKFPGSHAKFRGLEPTLGDHVLTRNAVGNCQKRIEDVAESQQQDEREQHKAPPATQREAPALLADYDSEKPASAWSRPA